MARSWGDKVVEWLADTWPRTQHWFDVESTYNPLAFLIAAACVGLLLCGVKESKRVANIFTMVKVALVAFMVMVALCYTRPSNWVPFVPYGVSGVIRGGACVLCVELCWMGDCATLTYCSYRLALYFDLSSPRILFQPQEPFLDTWVSTKFVVSPERPRTQNAIYHGPFWASCWAVLLCTLPPRWP